MSISWGRGGTAAALATGAADGTVATYNLVSGLFLPFRFSGILPPHPLELSHSSPNEHYFFYCHLPQIFPHCLSPCNL